MPKQQTHFEQVPLDAIKKIVDEEIREQSKLELSAKPKVKTSREELLLAAAGDRLGRRS
jgi:hypothetical protein